MSHLHLLDVVFAEPGLVGPGLHLVVEDNGPGMDADTLEKVQQPFVTTRARGTGLGLSIVRRLVEAHGGRLQLQSEKGQGTKARVFLPHREE